MTLTPTIAQEIASAADLLSNSYTANLNNVSRFRPNFTIETFPHSGLLCSDCGHPLSLGEQSIGSNK